MQKNKHIHKIIVMSLLMILGLYCAAKYMYNFDQNKDQLVKIQSVPDYTPDDDLYDKIKFKELQSDDKEYCPEGDKNCYKNEDFFNAGFYSSMFDSHNPEAFIGYDYDSEYGKKNSDK